MSWVTVPAPDIERLVGELDALLRKAILPVVFELLIGVKVTLNDALCPAESVMGKVSPLNT